MTPAEIAALPYRPCVGLMIVNAEGKVFVGQRRDKFADAWQMPQGGVDEGEAFEAAALRELREETGITPDLVEIAAVTENPIPYDLPPEVVPQFWGGRFRGQAQTWFLLRYKGTDSQVNIETEEPEFSRWKWVGTEELVPNIVPFKRAVYEQVVAQLGPKI